MLIEQTMDKMVSMKMNKMAESLKERLSRPDHSSLDKAEFLGLLVDDEFQHRQNKRMTSRLRVAQFKESQACIEGIEYASSRGFKKSDIIALAQNHWVRKHQNIALTGSSGVGKSYLAQALGNNLCRNGFAVIYTRFSKLLFDLTTAKVDGSYSRVMRKIARTNILILDDFGLAPMEEAHKQDLFEVVEERYGVGSIIIAAQLPIEHWHEYLGGGILGDGICDRLIHNCHKLNLSGESRRKRALDLTSKAPSESP